MSDPTDPGGVGAAQAERVSRTATRVGDTGSPVGSPLTIVLAVIAVVVGFLIFNSIDDSNAGGPEPNDVPAGEATTTVAGATTSVTAAGPTTTVAQGRVTDGADVIVINAGEVGGSAGDVSDLLAAAGYSMVEATNDSNQEQDADTIIYYSEGAPAAQAVAQSIARDLGLVESRAQAVPADGLEVDDESSLGSATVFVWLGTDRARITALEGEGPATPAAPPVPGTTTSTLA